MTGLGEDVWVMPKPAGSADPLQTMTDALRDIAAELDLDEADNERILIAIANLKKERARLLASLETLASLLPGLVRQMPYGVPMAVAQAHTEALFAIASCLAEE